MAKSRSGGNRPARVPAKGTAGKKSGGWPSKTGRPSGGGRTNNAPRTRKQK